jgi:hypothetical protein
LTRAGATGGQREPAGRILRRSGLPQSRTAYAWRTARRETDQVVKSARSVAHNRSDLGRSAGPNGRRAAPPVEFPHTILELALANRSAPAQAASDLNERMLQQPGDSNPRARYHFQSWPGLGDSEPR